MFIELVSSLRCLTLHEDTWLVAASRRMVGRRIVEGTLGCPVCRREYPIAAGVAYFGVPVAAPPDERASSAPAAPHDSRDDAFRLAAFLNLDSPGGTVVLGGRWASAARPLASLVGVHCLLLDPSDDGDVYEPRDDLSVIRSDGSLPLAAGAARGVALDAATSLEATLRGAVRALGAGRRLLAPTATPMPAEVIELARDDALWVGERTPPASAPVPIGVARRTTR